MPQNLKAIIPAYIYPDPNPQSQKFKDWQTILKHARESPDLHGVIVVSNNFGPGTANKDPNFARIIHELKKTPVKIYGYIFSKYGKGEKPLASAIADVRAWESLWGVTDIFVDETASGEDKIAYYAELNAWVKGEVILNPGVEPDAKYLKCGNIICSAETEYESYMDKRFKLPATAGKNRFYHIAMGVAASSMSGVLEQARLNADYVFITDLEDGDSDDGPTAFTQLPGYFERLMMRLKAI